jgi:predicted phage terminase large subunit-like protein
MLIWAWMKHLEMHGQVPDKLPGETKAQYDKRCMPFWGLVEWVAYSCRRFRVDKLLIEAKATGITCAQELRRLYKDEDWAIELPSPTKDKVARAHTAEPSFAAGLIWAPDTEWAEKVIAQAETFPKSKYKDLVDSSTQAVTWMRKHGLIAFNHEVAAEIREQLMHRPKEKPLYEA